MFDHAPLSLIVLDNQYRIQRWNKQAEKMFLWSEQEALGKHVDFLTPDALRSTIEAKLAKVHKEKKIIYSENWNLKKNNEEILCEWLNAPFQDQHEKSNFIICVARDITEQRCLQQQLEKSTIQVSAGIGISVCPDDSIEISTLIKIADNAMYQAKKQSKWPPHR